MNRRYVEFLETCFLYTFRESRGYAKQYWKGQVIELESSTIGLEGTHLNFSDFTYVYNVPNRLFKVIYAD